MSDELDEPRGCPTGACAAAAEITSLRNALARILATSKKGGPSHHIDGPPADRAGPGEDAPSQTAFTAAAAHRSFSRADRSALRKCSPIHKSAPTWQPISTATWAPTTEDGEP